MGTYFSLKQDQQGTNNLYIKTQDKHNTQFVFKYMAQKDNKISNTHFLLSHLHCKATIQ